MKPTPALIRHFRRPFSFLTTSVICATSVLTQSATATTGTWSGGATDTWDTSATNWSGVSGTPWDVTNGPNNDAVFNTASLNATISGAVFTSGMTFGTTGTLGGGSINLAGTSSINVASGQTGTINSPVAGSGTLTKSGDGTAIIDAPYWNANTFNGAVVVDGGTLQMGSTDPAEGLGNASSYTVNTGASLVSFANNPLNAGASYTLNGGTLKGSATQGHQSIGALTLNNGGTLEAGTGLNQWWQAFVLSGPVTVTGTSKSSITTTGASDSGVHLTPYGSADDTMRTFDVPDVTGDLNEDLRITAPLLNSAGELKRAGLIKTGGGMIMLDGANTYSGPTIINNGAILVIGTLGDTAITVNYPATLIGWGGWSLAHPITLNGGSLGFWNNHCAVGALTMNGGTMWTNTGVNDDWQSVFMIGNVTVGGSSASSILPGGSTANGIHLADHASGGSVIRTFDVADATGDGAADLIVSATLLNGRGDGATVGLDKTGGGTMTLSGANAYTGATTVTLGTLALVGGSQASPITVSGGASLGFTLGSPTTSTSSFNLSAGTIKITGTPILASYTLITSSSEIIGSSTLDPAVSGYELMVDGTSLKLVQTGGYASWMAPFITGGLTGDTTPGGDPENDGMTNLLEYALNGNPSISDPSIQPDLVVTATDFEFTYSRLDLSLADTTQTFEYGSDLSGWTPVVIPAGPGVDLPVGAAKVSIIDAGATDSVTISIPKSVGAGGKLFGRLQVIK